MTQNTPVEIILEGTPNPDAMKFVLDRPVQYIGTSTYIVKDECDGCDLARGLLEVAGVESVFFMKNFITLTRKPAGPSWNDLADKVKAVIRARIDSHDPAIVPQKASSEGMNSDQRIAKIETILEEEVRPGLAADGGGIEVVGLEGSVLTVRYQGACGSCPSSMTGTLMAIQELLRRNFDALIEVRPG